MMNMSYMINDIIVAEYSKVLVTEIMIFGLFTSICMLPIVMLAIYDIYESKKKK